MKRRARHGERGIGMVAIAVWIVALAVITAAAVDIARLSHTASEVQTIADAAALAGVKTLFDNNLVSDGTEVTAARNYAHLNRFDGKDFPVTDDATGAMTVDVGHYNGTTFTSGGSPTNAVRAVATGIDVQFVTANLIGSIFGSTATGSNVTKRATAAIGCGPNCQPQLPVMLCQGLVTNLDADKLCDSSKFTLGPISQIPSPTDTSCWSCLSTGCGANTQNYLNLFPPECGGTGAATASIGENIDISNGHNTPILQNLLNCIAPTSATVNGSSGKNKHFFRVPVSDNCNGCVQTGEVKNFVTLKIGCTDPNCTDRDHCDCTGTDASGRPYNTYNCSSANPCHVDPSNTDPLGPITPAVVPNGPSSGIWWAMQACDTQTCTGVAFADCGGLSGFALVDDN